MSGLSHEQAAEFCRRLSAQANEIAGYLKCDPADLKVDITFRLDPGPQYVVMDITKGSTLEAKVVEPVPTKVCPISGPHGCNGTRHP